jgi:hypothetical protein
VRAWETHDNRARHKQSNSNRILRTKAGDEQAICLVCRVHLIGRLDDADGRVVVPRNNRRDRRVREEKRFENLVGGGGGPIAADRVAYLSVIMVLQKIGHDVGE